jgi:hypothetical protein
MLFAGVGSTAAREGWRESSDLATFFCMSARALTPAATPSDAARRARVLALVDHAKRIAAMLDRWDAEDVSDEPDWDVTDIEPVALRIPSK